MIPWKDAYSVGNDRIDMQHQIFLGLVSEFSDAHQVGLPLEKLSRVLEEIIKYAEYHFMSEENMMSDCHYPELDKHRIIHNHLLSQAKAKASEMALGQTTPQQIEDFLTEWFILHTQHEDRKISEFLKDCGTE